MIEGILKIIGLVIVAYFAFILLLMLFGSFKPSKFQKKTISDTDFKQLKNLFFDAANIYSCPETKETKAVAPAAKIAAMVIGKLVSNEQKHLLIEELEWILDMARKTGVAKVVIEKNIEIINEISVKDWSPIDAIKDKGKLNDMNKDLLDAINNFQGNYFNDKFPSHFS